MNPSVEELRKLFANAGLRTTRQREVIYRTLLSTETHPTVEELLEMVHSQDPEVSQATIYNSLEAFVDCHLATRIPSSCSGGACRYDANTGSHIHLVLDDGRILDAPTDLSQRILESVPQSVLNELSERTGVEVSGFKIELFGRA